MGNQDVAEKLATTVQQGAVVLQMENDTQRSIAIQQPRDEAKVLEGALKELELYPQFAAKAYYVIPYKDRSDGEEKTVNVEGPSIKAAMALGRRWGNGANGARVVGEDEKRIMLEGVFLDYETNFRTVRPISVSKQTWSKKAGKVVPLRDDRLNMAIMAGASKCVRNAILAALPVGLVEMYTAKAKQVAAGGTTKKGEVVKPIAERLKAMFLTFEKLGVAKNHVEAYLAEHHELESDEAVLAHMIGVYNAIEDGIAKTEQVFETMEKAERAAPAEPQRAQPAAAPTAPKITLQQRTALAAHLEQNKIKMPSLNDFLRNQYGYEGTENIPADQYQAIWNWVSGGQIEFGK